MLSCLFRLRFAVPHVLGSFEHAPVEGLCGPLNPSLVLGQAAPPSRFALGEVVQAVVGLRVQLHVVIWAGYAPRVAQLVG
eukprot:394250-Lingulodinium_polyedra.AAC.1